MKTIHPIGVICFLYFAASITLSAQTNPGQGLYDVHSTKVLATAGNYTLTEGLFNKALRFTEFLLGTRLTPEEIQEGLEESIVSFQQSPQQIIQETEMLDQQMQMVYQLTDPTQIALVRSSIICQLYVTFANSPEQPVLRRLMEKYTPVLAYDPANMLAFTEQDFQAFLDYTAFMYQLYGQPFSIDEATANQYREYFIQQFLQGTVEVRQSLCVMSEVGPYIQAVWQNLPEAQKQTLIASLYQSQQPAQQNTNDEFTRDAYGNIDYTNPENIDKMWPEGVDTPEEKQAYLMKRQREINSFNASMNIWNEMSLQNHATMLNVINNLGGSDDYWEVKYRNW
ncbi:MAG: hypothetical protein D6714_07645 [Bacteroidetes bacterium]|nr:MAG: hypothetical protein D6714_07645 [Bacteroidota bacterium]